MEGGGYEGCDPMSQRGRRVDGPRWEGDGSWCDHDVHGRSVGRGSLRRTTRFGGCEGDIDGNLGQVETAITGGRCYWIEGGGKKRRCGCRELHPLLPWLTYIISIHVGAIDPL